MWAQNYVDLKVGKFETQNRLSKHTEIKIVEFIVYMTLDFTQVYIM